MCLTLIYQSIKSDSSCFGTIRLEGEPFKLVAKVASHSTICSSLHPAKMCRWQIAFSGQIICFGPNLEGRGIVAYFKRKGVKDIVRVVTRIS